MLIDIIRIAENNPNNSQLTSKVEKYVNKSGNQIIILVYITCTYYYEKR